jgi:hypothetical protein
MYEIPLEVADQQAFKSMHQNRSSMAMHEVFNHDHAATPIGPCLLLHGELPPLVRRHCRPPAARQHLVSIVLFRRKHLISAAQVVWCANMGQAAVALVFKGSNRADP